jgi:hypothetical protein
MGSTLSISSARGSTLNAKNRAEDGSLKATADFLPNLFNASARPMVVVGFALSRRRGRYCCYKNKLSVPF